MFVEIRPEPSEEERAAIVATVERLLAEEARDERASEWWAAGLRESLEGEEEGLYEATARPRSSAGATRA